MKRFLSQYRVMITGLIALCLFMGAKISHGQEFLKNYAQPLPEISLLPVEEFNAKTILYEETPANDKSLSYRFRLPKDWKKPEDLAVTSYQVSDKILGEIVRFYGPPLLDTRSIFSIQAINLEYKLTATQWMLQYLLANGYTIQGMKEINEDRSEALYVKVENDVTYVIRAIAQINGKRVVLAQYIMPADNWEEEKHLQAQIMGTFELTHPVEELIEPMQKYHFLDLAEFNYPASWQYQGAPVNSAERVTFNLLNVASEQKIKWTKYKTLNGRIQADIVAYDLIDTPEEEIEKLKANLSKLGLIATEQLETRNDFRFNEGVEPVPVYIFKVTDSENNLLQYEYWILAMEAGDYFYFVSLVTPSRDEDFFIWARNTETYKLIIKMFTPLEDSLTTR